MSCSALSIEDAHVEQALGLVAQRLRSDPVGLDDAQALRLDKKDHLLGMVEQQAIKAAHGLGDSLFAALASK